MEMVDFLEFKLKITNEKDEEAFLKIWNLVIQNAIYSQNMVEILDFVVRNGYGKELIKDLKACGKAQIEGILNDAVRNNYVALAKAILELDSKFKVYPGPISDAKILKYDEILKLLKGKGKI